MHNWSSHSLIVLFTSVKSVEMSPLFIPDFETLSLLSLFLSQFI